MKQGVNCAQRRRLLGCLAGMLMGATLVSASSARADLMEIVPRIKHSVVAVGTYQRTRSPAFRFLGTGFVIGNGRLVATNAHVLPEALAADQLETLVVVQPGGESGQVARQATRAAVDRNHDLAILKLDDGATLPALSLGGGGNVREGQAIAFTGFPIGNALGMTPVTHRGIVAAITPIGIPQGNARDLNPALVRRLGAGSFPVYQLDATAYPGNSGSPVFDPESGDVVGVINMVFVKTTKESVLSDPSGISYAIPVEHLRALLASVQ